MNESTWSLFGISFSNDNIINVFQTAALIITIIVMWRTSNEQAEHMKEQVSELNHTIRLTAHNYVSEKLLSLYSIYAANPDVARSLWPLVGGLDDTQLKERFVFMYIMDLLLHIYLNKTWLSDEITKQSWQLWTRGIHENGHLTKLYDEMKEQYPSKFVEAIDASRNS